MRYLSLYVQASPVVCIDLKKPRRADIIDGIYYAEKFDIHGFQSNYKNIYRAEFKRTTETKESVTSKQIVWWDIPKRLSKKEVMTLLEDLLRRGKDKKKRKMNPNSLANLKPAKPFTSVDRPSKPRLLSDHVLDRALELRSDGCSWRKVGDLLGCNHHTVRSSLRRREEKTANSDEVTKLLTGHETSPSYHPTGEGCSTR